MVLCLCVEPRCAEDARRRLRSLGLLSRRHRVVRHGGLICFPLAALPPGSLAITGCSHRILDLEAPLLPEKPGRPLRGFDIVGGVVIVRANALEGIDQQVFIEEVRRLYPGVKAIYVKEGTWGEHRVGRLRLLWGREVEYVEHREHGLRLWIPIHKAYYNPRLSTEHRLVAESVVPGERIIDMFAGIGGFSLHIASLADALVVANDINPYAVEAAIRNVEMNRKRLRGRIVVVMSDAAQLPVILRPGSWDRVIANLPHGSTMFRDVYERLLRRGGLLMLYLVAGEAGEALLRIREELGEGWMVAGWRRVLEYSPRRYIYRFNLIRL